MTDDSSKLDILEQRVATLEEVVASIGSTRTCPNKTNCSPRPRSPSLRRLAALHRALGG